MATFHTFLHMPEIHELVLCGRNRDKIEGELTDFKDSHALNTDIKTRIRGGGYEMTAAAAQIVNAVIHASVIASTTMTKEELEALAASAEVIRSNS